MKRRYSASDISVERPSLALEQASSPTGEKACAGAQIDEDCFSGDDDIAFETLEEGHLTTLDQFIAETTLSCEQSLLPLISTSSRQFTKETFLEDVKRWIYSYCTTSLFDQVDDVSGPNLLERDPDIKLKVLKVINYFKLAIEKMQTQQKQLKLLVTEEIASRQAVHRLQ